MRMRHKQPTLVSMWMLDVFCCALGCVTLMWLLKTLESSITASSASQKGQELALVQMDLIESTANNLNLRAEIDEQGALLARVQKQHDELAKQLDLVRDERDRTARNLNRVVDEMKATEASLRAVRAERDATLKSLDAIKAQNMSTAEALARKEKDILDLTRRVAQAQNEVESLDMLLKERERLRQEAVKQLGENAQQLATLEKKYQEASRQLAGMTAKQTDISRMQARITDLEKKLAQDQAQIIDLQGDKAKLADKVNQLQIESEQRFAGITMTGKRVIFLVDMSGSMDRTDIDTIDQTKWPIVRDTLTKVMRSLPNLEKFQVIMFSNRVSYLVGDGKDWINFEKEPSITRIARAMTEIKPLGDTNMYAALEEAFRFRYRGLDTIYLISDGLPTSGPGLDAAQEKLPDTTRSNLLARHIRRTLATTWNKPDPVWPRVRIHSIGFFYESPDVGAFLWALSRENDGSFVGMSKP